MTRQYLRSFSEEELQAELERREKERRENKRPTLVENPDFSNVIRDCIAYVDHLHKHDYEPKDLDHYVFEHAMKAVFGPGVFDWINKKLR